MGLLYRDPVHNLSPRRCSRRILCRHVLMPVPSDHVRDALDHKQGLYRYLKLDTGPVQSKLLRVDHVPSDGLCVEQEGFDDFHEDWLDRCHIYHVGAHIDCECGSCRFHEYGFFDWDGSGRSCN